MRQEDLLLPTSVSVIFPTIRGGVPSSTPAVYAISLSSLALPEFFGANGRTGFVRVLHSTAVAVFAAATGGTATNNAEMLALAQQIATDFFRHLAGRAELTLSGIQAWRPSGLDDCTEWDHSGEKIVTRSRPVSWLSGPDDLAHASTVGGSAQLATSAGVTYAGGTVNVIGAATTFTGGSITFSGVAMHGVVVDECCDGCECIEGFEYPNPYGLVWINNDAWDVLNLASADGVLTATGGVLSVETAGAGDVTAASSLTDEAVVRGNGGVKGVQTSTMTISDAGAVVIAFASGATTSSANVLMVGHNSSGTPAAGFGTSFVLRGSSATVADRFITQWHCEWVDATDATRKGRATHYAYDTLSREYMRGEASGSVAMVGFLGASAALQQTGDAGTALVTFGLMSGTPTFALANVASTGTGPGIVQQATTSSVLTVSQETTGVTGASFTANSGTAVNDASTFDGYTLKQVVKALRNLHILA